MNDFITHIENTCIEFVNAFQDQLTWKWDGRFDAVLTAFKRENKDDIFLFLKQHLNTVWDDSNTEDASDSVLDAISHFGGLMPRQLLFASDPNQDIFICCAWWPWNNGNTISLRVAPFSNKLSDEDKTELNKKMKAWFKI
ncbi:MAG: hypothetical protein C4518_00195 [Desulfobacteraceae bacterium]|nr:MAG: hypothetical protein C4518_00195 [Desulfobacteraceae bacterium]